LLGRPGDQAAPLIEVEQPAEPRAASHATRLADHRRARDQLIIEALVIPFALIVLDVLRNDTERRVSCGRDRLGHMATTTTPHLRESHKKLKPKPKTESKSWQTRNMARKEKQAAYAAKRTAETGH